MALINWSNKKEKKTLNSTDLQAIQLLSALNEQRVLTTSEKEVPPYVTEIIAGGGESVPNLTQHLSDLQTLELFLELLQEIEALRILVDNGAKIDSPHLMSDIEEQIIEKFRLIQNKLDLIGVKPEFLFDNKATPNSQRRMILHFITDAINDAGPKVTEAYSRLNSNLSPLMQRVADASIDTTNDLSNRVARLQTRWEAFTKYNESMAILSNPKYSVTNFFYRRAIAKLELDLEKARKNLAAVTPNDFSIKTPVKFKDALTAVIDAEDALKLVRLQALYGPWAYQIRKKEIEIEINKRKAHIVKPLYDNFLWNIITGTSKRDQYVVLVQANERLLSDIDTLTKTANERRGNVRRDEPFQFVSRYIPDTLFARIHDLFARPSVSASVTPPGLVEEASVKPTEPVERAASPEPVQIKKHVQEIADARNFADGLERSNFDFRDLRKHLLIITEFGDAESNRKMGQWIRNIKNNFEPSLAGETKKTARGDGATKAKESNKIFEWLDPKEDASDAKDNDSIRGLALYLETNGYKENDEFLKDIFNRNLGDIEDSIAAVEAICSSPVSYKAPLEIEKRYQMKGNFALNVIRILLTGNSAQVESLHSSLFDLYNKCGNDTTSELPLVIGEIMQHWKPLPKDDSEVKVNNVWEKRYEHRKAVVVTPAPTKVPAITAWSTAVSFGNSFVGAVASLVPGAPAATPLAGKGMDS